MDLDPEIAAFSAKATRYLRALQRAPNARILEIVPILSAVEAMAGRLEGTAVLGDAMAGSGYLARHLSALSHPVVAYEACDAMMTGGEPRSFRYAPIEDVHDIPAKLRDDGVRVAASLASFHHLVVADQNPSARPRSVIRQIDLVRDCFRAAPGLAHFIVGDVVDSSEPILPQGDWPWCGDDSAQWKLVLRRAGQDVLAASPSSAEYASAVYQLAPALPSDPSRWFREVVDAHSIVGHRDCFLQCQLIRGLSQAGLEVSARVFPTTWLFASRADLERFLWDKFAFKEADPDFGRAQVWGMAERLLGIKALPSGQYALGWQLGYVIASRTANVAIA